LEQCVSPDRLCKLSERLKYGALLAQFCPRTILAQMQEP
jgi:hypothetical protein